MKKKLLILLFLIITITTNSLTFAQNNNNKKTTNSNAVSKKSSIKPLTFKTSDHMGFMLNGSERKLSEIIEYLLRENKDIQQVLYDAAKSDSNYLKYQAKYSPYVQGAAGFSQTEYSEDLHQFTGIETKERNGSIGLSKGFITGTTISAGFQNTYSNSIDQNPNFGDIRYHQPVLFASLEQELLKNFLGYKDRRENKILKNSDKMIQELASFQTSAITVNSIVRAWQLTLSYSALSNSKLKLSEIKRVRRIISKNVNLGVNEKFDLNYWNSLVAGNEAIVANNNYNFKELNRKVKTDFNLTDDFDTSNITILSDTLPELNFNLAFKLALKYRADYQNALLQVKNSKMQLEIHKNDALPSLTGKISYSSAGQRDEFNDAFQDTRSFENPAYEATIQMTYPLNDTMQKANERDSEIDLKKSKINLEQTKRLVKNDILNSIDRVTTTFKAYSKAKRSRLESEKYYVQLRSYLRRGKYSSSVVNDALTAMIDSRQRELEALVSYNASLLNFDLVQNLIFQKNKINIKKHIKDKKDF